MNTQESIRTSGRAPLQKASDDVLRVHADLNDRLNRLADEGFVDIHMFKDGGKNGSTPDDLWVMNNLLRQREKGNYKKLSGK